MLLYIDPGSGSLLIQLILSGALTLLASFRKVRVFLMSFFKQKKDDNG